MVENKKNTTAINCTHYDKYECGSCKGVPDGCHYKEFCGRHDVRQLRDTQRHAIKKANCLLQLLSFDPKEVEV